MTKTSKIILGIVIAITIAVSIVVLRVATCPEYVNCMPGPDIEKTCKVPVGCGSITKKAQ